MTEVGILGLDTSHPEAFASIIDESDRADVAAVWDGGTVRDREHVEAFCEEYGATRYDEPADMVGAVDAALVLTVDWDAHRELAVPFLEAGVPALIDKPVAGRLADVERIASAAGDTPVFGGSSVPYHPALDPIELGADGTLYCAGYDDPFYYGSHLADSVRRLAGADWSRVRPADDPGLVVDVEFENGAFATVKLDGSDEDKTFGFMTVDDATEAALVGSDEADRHTMYESFLGAFLDAVAGTADETDRVLDGATLLLGIHAALSTGEAVTPDGDALADLHVADDDFVAAYSPYY